MGELLPVSSGPAVFTLRASAPPGATTVLLRNGDPVARAPEGYLEYQTAALGAFRVEIHLPKAPGTPPVPWIVTNPIYRLPPAAAVQPVASIPVGERTALTNPEWHAELGTGSGGSVSLDGESVTLSYALGSRAGDSPFAALAVDLRPEDTVRLQGGGDLVIQARSESPMRVSVQLRFAADQEQRWGTSIYLNQTMRWVRVPLNTLRPTTGTRERPALSRATSLLFVVDLTNAHPGTTGSFTVSEVALSEEGS